MQRIMILSEKTGVIQEPFFNLRVSLLGGCKYFCEYLRENKIFENILGCDSRDNVLAIYEKSQT